MTDSTASFTSLYPHWVIPSMEIPHHRERSNDYCVVIPVINEGPRIKSLLLRMKAHKISSIADIIIIDGGSTDGSLRPELLVDMDVNTLLVKTGDGKLSAQLRCAYAFMLHQGYRGVVTIDGNNKDDPKDIPRFIDAMESGADFVQGSRFLPGGIAINTPASRDFAIRFIHAPCLRIASGFNWTDTTQGFRGYSSRLLNDKNLDIFREVFSSYELLAYLSYRAPKLGFKCTEIATTREYPQGEIPTKISTFKGNFLVLKILLLASLGRYNN